MFPAHTGVLISWMHLNKWQKYDIIPPGIQKRLPMTQTYFPRTFYGFYLLCIKKFPWYFGTVFVIGVLINIIGMIFGPLTSKWMMQIFENAATISFNSVLGLVLLIVGMYIISPILSFIDSFLTGRYQMPFNQYKQYLLYGFTYENDIPFFIDNPSGSVVSYLMRVSRAFGDLMNQYIVQFIGTVIGFLIVAATMGTMNYWFVVILISYGIIKTIWEWFLQNKINKIHAQLRDEDSKFLGVRTDSFNNALTVKWFANQHYENMYIYKKREILHKLFHHTMYLDRCQWVPTNILWHCIQIVILLMCFVMIKNSTISIAQGAYIIAGANSINTAFNKITRIVRKYSEEAVQVKKAYEKLKMERKILDKQNAKKIKVTHGTIKFENVNFAYGKNKVFKNFNLEIKPKEKVGIVGLSGAGKTTLCSLLLRMWDVDSGAITVDGMDIRDVTQKSLLQNISFVPQESTLFNRSLLDNIRYAKPTTPLNQVIKIARKANIHDFINELPDKYNTLVGNNGIKLSGGQRQRVSIARALLKDAPILVLDEATSALDSRNEIQIQKSLQNAMHGKTTLVIAHRLSTLRNMDRIIVIDHGKIIETGTHAQLLRKRGLYHSLYKMQTSGFIK